MTLVEDLPMTQSSEQRKMLLDFLRQSGYGPSDLLSLNYQTREFYTRNGGKYYLDDDPDNTLKYISGPSEDPSERM